MQNAYLTQERYDEIVEDLKQLKTSGRQEIADRLKQAKDLGDLSENYDYQEAREDQRRLEERIGSLEGTIRHSVIIKKAVGASTVRIGSKVKVKRNGEIIFYTIVGSNETDPGAGLISNESPIGKGLLGKKVGDMVYVKTPKGDVPYQVMSIE